MKVAKNPFRYMQAKNPRPCVIKMNKMNNTPLASKKMMCSNPYFVSQFEVVHQLASPISM